jgi:hypothetical protein
MTNADCKMPSPRRRERPEAGTLQLPRILHCALCISCCVLALVSAVGLSAAGSPTLLIDAIKAGNKAAVMALLKQPDEVNARAVDGTTPLH